MKLEEVVQMDFEIVVVDGLRIGGSGGDLEIGGTVDANLAAIRDPVTGEPYLPGSSIKGKLRSIAEKIYGTFRMDGQRGQTQVRMQSSDGSPCRCGQVECNVCPVFGAHMNTRGPSAPTRITVRDAHFTDDYRVVYKQKLAETGRYFEQKTENLVNRKTGTAEHPRTGERVPSGARFQGRIILRTYDTDGARKETYVKTIEQALGLLQEADSLGASGSRGFGTVRFENAYLRRRKAAEIRLQFLSV